MTLDPAVQRIADEAEIRNLVAELTQLADTASDEQLDRYVALFTDDAVWAVLADSKDLSAQERKGHQEILAGVQERRAAGIQGPGTDTRHSVSTLVVTFESSERALARCYWHYYTHTSSSAPVLALMGEYRHVRAYPAGLEAGSPGVDPRMTSMSSRPEGSHHRRQVTVVTGGGGGIGSEAALELSRRNTVVIAVDSGVGVRGEPFEEPTAAETVKRIEADGGIAVASTISVTDREAVRALFHDVVDEYGSLDIVVNAAGILRWPTLLHASEDDWRSVLESHFGGYLNVLSAAVPIMIEAGYGRIVGFTSGVGMARTSVNGIAYGSAKRAVAALTWQLAALLPEGVRVNAISPIAASRMIREALVAEGTTPKGLDLSDMPQPEDMAPALAYLSSEEIGWCSGQVIFSAGPELSAIAPPRLIEAVRTEHVSDFATALATLFPVVFGPAEADQRTTGGSNPRFGPVFQQSGPIDAAGSGPSERRHCVIVSDSEPIAQAVASTLAGWGLTPVGVGAWQPFDDQAGSLPSGFAGASETLLRASQAVGGVDAVVVVLGAGTAPSAGNAEPWQEMLTAHAGVTENVVSHGGWLHAAFEHAHRASRPFRIVHVVDATSAAGRTAAQSVAQMARSADDTPSSVQFDVFSISVETAAVADDQPLGQLIARLVGADDAPPLRGAELFTRPGWMGLRAHPGPVATVSFGRGPIPSWVADSLRQVVTPYPG